MSAMVRCMRGVTPRKTPSCEDIEARRGVSSEEGRNASRVRLALVRCSRISFALSVVNILFVERRARAWRLRTMAEAAGLAIARVAMLLLVERVTKPRTMASLALAVALGKLVFPGAVIARLARAAQAVRFLILFLAKGLTLLNI